MDIREHIEHGAIKTGSFRKLAETLEIHENNLRLAKTGKRSLPNDAVVKLAAITGEELGVLLAANELTTEKKEDKRRFWMNYLDHAKAACVAGAAGAVITFATPSPAEATPAQETKTEAFLVMLNRLFKRAKIAAVAALQIQPLAPDPKTA